MGIIRARDIEVRHSPYSLSAKPKCRLLTQADIEPGGKVWWEVNWRIHRRGRHHRRMYIRNQRTRVYDNFIQLPQILYWPRTYNRLVTQGVDHIAMAAGPASVICTYLHLHFEHIYDMDLIGIYEAVALEPIVYVHFNRPAFSGYLFSFIPNSRQHRQ